MSSAEPDAGLAGAPLRSGEQPGSRPVLLDAAVTTRCRRRVHLEHDPGVGRRERGDAGRGRGAAVLPEPDPGVEMRVADAAEHREALAARFAEMLGASYRRVPDGPRAERVAATLALAADGAARPRSEPPSCRRREGRRGHAELLVRAAGAGGAGTR